MDKLEFIHVKDASLRRLTGDEQPMGAMPSMTDSCCVKEDDVIPDNCFTCVYGGGGAAAPGASIMCGHPDSAAQQRVFSYPCAKAGRQPWCPITHGRFE